ncbi:MAG: hypothetical protein KKI06_02550, partial [Euryarchaeota archaeon]|nr:hypothetical protein [Euryarchaeota archaeon]
STGYVREYFGKKNIGYLGFLYNIFILSMIFVVTASNAVMFLIVWELMSVISYFLVIYEHEKPETRKAGFIYIVMTHMGAGSLIYSTHTKNIEEMGGLIKKMPWTALFFLIGSVSISALPPFNGFVSEWLTFQAQLLSINLSDNITKIAILSSGAALALTSALAAACFVKAFGISILSVLCIALGVFPFYFVRILDGIASPLVGTSVVSKITFDLSIATEAGSISTAWLFILLFIFIPIILILALTAGGRTGTKTYETWGCGQPATTGRNEYTATAFSKPIRMWFGNIYRPHREIHTTYAGSPYFKERFAFGSEIEPIFEKYLYSPVAWIVLASSRVLRVIQTGSLQLYLLYILITLVIALIYVGSGG